MTLVGWTDVVCCHWVLVSISYSIDSSQKKLWNALEIVKTPTSTTNQLLTDDIYSTPKPLIDFWLKLKPFISFEDMDQYFQDHLFRMRQEGRHHLHSTETQVRVQVVWDRDHQKVVKLMVLSTLGKDFAKDFVHLHPELKLWLVYIM